MVGAYGPAGFSAQITPQNAGFPGLHLQKNNFREWYSWAVVAAVASAAGLVCHVPAIDANQKDFLVETLGMYKGRQRSIRLQLKASSSLNTAHENGVDYVTMSFSRAYYDAFQAPATIPLFLILVALPPLTAPWTHIKQTLHELHASAWWVRLTEPPNGLANQTVRIPVDQRLDLTGLHAMLSMA